MTEPFKLITREDEWRSEVNASVVDILEEMLVMAKNGELGGIVVAVTKLDGTGSYRVSKMNHALNLLGVVTTAMHRMAADD